MYCIRPKLKHVPDGDWYCTPCTEIINEASPRNSHTSNNSNRKRKQRLVRRDSEPINTAADTDKGTGTGKRQRLSTADNPFTTPKRTRSLTVFYTPDTSRGTVQPTRASARLQEQRLNQQLNSHDHHDDGASDNDMDLDHESDSSNGSTVENRQVSRFRNPHIAVESAMLNAVDIVVTQNNRRIRLSHVTNDSRIRLTRSSKANVHNTHDSDNDNSRNSITPIPQQQARRPQNTADDQLQIAIDDQPAASGTSADHKAPALNSNPQKNASVSDSSASVTVRTCKCSCTCMSTEASSQLQLQLPADDAKIKTSASIASACENVEAEVEVAATRRRTSRRHNSHTHSHKNNDAFHSNVNHGAVTTHVQSPSKHNTIISPDSQLKEMTTASVSDPNESTTAPSHYYAETQAQTQIQTQILPRSAAVESFSVIPSKFLPKLAEDSFIVEACKTYMKALNGNQYIHNKPINKVYESDTADTNANTKPTQSEVMFIKQKLDSVYTSLIYAELSKLCVNQNTDAHTNIQMNGHLMKDDTRSASASAITSEVEEVEEVEFVD
jgi:hypothetical protein